MMDTLVDLGYSMIVCTSDVGILRTTSKERAADLRKMLGHSGSD